MLCGSFDLLYVDMYGGCAFVSIEDIFLLTERSASISIIKIYLRVRHINTLLLTLNKGFFENIVKNIASIRNFGLGSETLAAHHTALAITSTWFVLLLGCSLLPALLLNSCLTASYRSFPHSVVLFLLYYWSL